MTRWFRQLGCALGLVLGMGIGGAARAQELVPWNDTQLLLHCNGTPDGAAGETPGMAEGLDYAAGKFFEGLVLGSGDQLRYPAAGNITATSGTVETWIKPDWNGNDGQNHVLLAWGGAGGILVTKDGANNLRIILNRYGAGGQPETGVSTPIGSWVAGQWHHVAFTWDATAIRVYTDGVQRAQTSTPIALPEIPAEEFEVGGEEGANLAGTLDEFRVSDTAHAPTLVQIAYNSGSYAADELPFDSHTQLLLHLNGNTVGIAGEYAVQSFNITYGSGRYGQAANLTSASRLYYTAAGNITAGAGTVEGWFKPDWNGNDGQNHLILTWGGSGGLLIGKDAADNLRLILNRYSAGGLPEIGTAVNIGEWLANEWHHLAFTWDADWMRIFIDGGLAAEASVTIPLPAITAANFQIGGEGSSSALRAVVDEFRISDRARTGMETAHSYLAGLQISALSLTPDILPLPVGETATPILSAQTDLGNAEIPPLCAQWSSSDPGVADVTPEGVVTALAGGGATVSATVRGLTAQMQVSVPSPCLPGNPAQVRATALNEAVRLRWTPLDLPAECFGLYRVFRGTGPFSDVTGLAPVAELGDAATDGWLDEGLPNDQPFWYAVVGVDAVGAFLPQVTSVGPRTPHGRQDLQVACIRRGPQFPRYAPTYTTYEITEPGGYGPYVFSAATGLDLDQGCGDPHSPQPGESVTWTAVVRNAGTVAWEGDLPWVWWVDGVLQEEGQRWLTLAPGDTAQFAHTRAWDEDGHSLQFSIYSWDDRGENNDLVQDARSVPFKTYVDASALEDFRERTSEHPGAWTDNLVDWLQRHMQRFNDLFEQAGTPKRVHYDLLQVLDDTAADPLEPPDILFGIFPFRYRAGEGDPRSSGYYQGDDDIDYGLLHELAHQLGLVDIYQLNVPAEANLVSGLPYQAHEDLMHGCSPFIGPHSAGAMTRWWDQGHGYFGQYLYHLPETLRMRFLDIQGNPLAGAQVEVFQVCERPGLGKVITDQVKFSGATDGDGVFVLPNVDVDENLAPPTCLGDALHDNPFGYQAVIATNGVLHFRVTRDGSTRYAWLDVTEANVAFWNGQTGEATFERQLPMGGEPDFFLEADVAEGNAGSWAIATNGDNQLADDTASVLVGSSSLRAWTSGDFLTLIYPGNRLGRYDLSGCDSLVFWTRVDNDWDFKMNAPQIRLYGPGDSFVQFVPDHDLLTEAGGAWRRVAVPLAGGEGWERREGGTPDLTQVNGLEFFADTWDWDFTWWLDGVGFTPACCATDCNGNGVRDCDDIAGGASLDLNGNQVPDECECSGVVPATTVQAALAGDQLQLTWNPVTTDTGGCPLASPLYHLWQAAEAYGPWTVVATTSEPAATLPLDGLRAFFRVTVEDAPPPLATPAAPARRTAAGD